MCAMCVPEKIGVGTDFLTLMVRWGYEWCPICGTARREILRSGRCIYCSQEAGRAKKRKWWREVGRFRRKGLQAAGRMAARYLRAEHAGGDRVHQRPGERLVCDSRTGIPDFLSGLARRLSLSAEYDG